MNRFHCFDCLIKNKRSYFSRTIKHLANSDKISKFRYTSNEVRQSFLDYFINEHQHEFYRSSPVIPDENDQSLLFVNAGMNQFKPIFLNQLDQFESLRRLRRVVNSQKCIRVGGKHCDLKMIGTDFSHHSFFEMLGNWSFGDYYKAEACSMAWDLLTKVYAIDPRKLFVTIFSGNEELGLEPDFESYEIWRSIGVPKNRIISLGMKDNFWEMEKIGPCGICTEIHYLFKEPSSQVDFKSFMLENSIEIWNLVFMQYFRDPNGKLHSLKKNFVDTGMGLERILSIVQNVPNNYATDLFTPYFDRLSKLCQWPEYTHKLDDEKDIAYRILADHSRMASVAIADGVVLNDRGVGYLLRRIIRRSIESLETLCKIKPLPLDVTRSEVFFNLAETTISILGSAYPELERESSRIYQTLDEEVRYYFSAIKRNFEVNKYSRLLQLKFKEDPEHNERKILEKLNQIELNIQNIKQSLKDNFMNAQNVLRQQRNDLQNVQELISVNESFAQRFGLLSDRLEKKFNDLDIKITDLENESHQIFQEIIQNFLLEADKKIYQGENYNILPININNISNHIDYNFCMKIALDVYGHNPLALVLKMESNVIFLQLSVPSSFNEKLTANIWFDLVQQQISSLLKSEIIRIKPLITKRVNKIVKYRIECTKQNVETFYETLISNLYTIGQKYFDNKS